MKVQSCFLAFVLTAALVQPLFAACIGDVLQPYLKNPQGARTPGTVLANTQFALVKIVAVHQDAKPRIRYMEATGTLELSRIESKDSTLPAHFSVPYEDREVGEDCDTWDYFKPKPGERIVAFFGLMVKAGLFPTYQPLGSSAMLAKCPLRFGQNFSHFSERNCKACWGMSPL